MASPVVLTVTRLDKTLKWSWSGVNAIADLDSVQKLTLHVTDNVVATVANPDPETHLKRYNIADLAATSYTVPVGDLVVGSKYYGRLYVDYVDTNADELIVGSNIAPTEAATDPTASALVSELGAPTVTAVTGHQEITVTFENFTSALVGDELLSSTKFVIVYSEAQGNVALEKVVVPIADMDNTGDNYSYTITGLDNLVRYEVSAYFQNALGSSSVVNTYATPSEIPSAPTSLTANPSTTDNLQIVVSWTAPVLSTNDASIDYYRIYRSVDNVTYEQLTDVTGADTTFVDGQNNAALVNGQTYYYKVAAMRDVRTDLGENDVVPPGDDDLIIGAESNVDSAIALNLVANAPELLLETYLDDQNVYLTITRPDNVTAEYVSDPLYSAEYSISFQVSQPGQGVGTSFAKTVAFDGSATQQVSYNDFAVFGDSVTVTATLDQTYDSNSTVGATGQGNLDASGNVVDITLYSSPVAATNLASTPVSLVGAEYVSLSTQSNGVLRLKWTHVEHDLGSSGTGGKFTDDLRYRVLLSGVQLQDPDGNNYDNIDPVSGENTIDLEGLTLGDEHALSVQAYYTNSENQADVDGTESARTAQSNIPFVQPSASSIVLSLDASGESIASRWTAVTSNELGSAPESYFKHYTPVLDDTLNNNTVYNTITPEGVISNATVGADNVYDLTLGGLTNGIKYQMSINFVIEFSDAFYNTTVTITTNNGPSETRTPFSDPVAPTPIVTFFNPDLAGYQNVSSVASGGKLWVQWTDIQYDYVNGSPGEFSNLLRYRIVVTNNGGTTDGNQTIDAATATQEITGLTLGATYTISMTSYFQNPESNTEVESTTADEGNSIASFRTPFAAPSQPTLDPLVENNEELIASWAATSDNGLAVSGYYIERTGAPQEDIGNVLSHTYNALSNGVEYSVTLIAYSSFTGTSDGVAIVDERYESVVSSGVTGIPFDRPIVSSDSLVTSNSLELQFTNNGRQLREVLIVAIPEDSNSNQDIAVVQYTGPSFAASAWNDANNTDTSLVTRTITELLPYNCKAVLWVIENEAGSTVGTVGAIDA